jgi:DNA-binding PadR family transcriptional regulator
MTPVFRHGRLRLYLLRLLDEEPRHGYEVIRLLRDRFMGVYAPSPGTIYPRLARLEEEGLVTHDEENGRKVYRITEAGREELRSRGDELDELEEELSASVSDIVREVREDVRDTVRSLREELTRAAREMRGAEREQARQARESARDANDAARDHARQLHDAARDVAREHARQAHETVHEAGEAAREHARQAKEAARDAAEAAREQARQARDAAREAAEATREQARQGRESAWAQAKQARDEARDRARHLFEGATHFRDDPGTGGAGGKAGNWGQWGHWGDWSQWTGNWSGQDFGALRDFERLARDFATDLRGVAWDSGTLLGSDVIPALRDILADTLDRIRTEVFDLHPQPPEDTPPESPEPPATSDE